MIISNGNKKNFNITNINNDCNLTINDVIGNKKDNRECNSIYGKLCNITRYLTNQDRCYPSLDDGITVSSGESTWEQGSYTEIIPANTVTSSFRIHKIYIESTTDGGCWQLDFYKGILGNEELIGSIRQSGISEIKGDAEIKTKCLDANERVTCKASHSSGSEGITISIGYNHS